MGYLLIAALVGCAPVDSLRRFSQPVVVEPEVLGAMPFPGPRYRGRAGGAGHGLAAGDVLRYVVAVYHFSSATVDSLYCSIAISR